MYHIPAHKNTEHPAAQFFPPATVKSKPTLDFSYVNHGSLVVLTARSAEARAWAEENLPEDCAKWGSFGYVIEPRYFGNVVDGLTGDGLTI